MKTALVVENDQILGHMYQKLLESSGFRVFLADSALSAMTFLKNNDIDFLLLDIMLNGKLNGFDLLEIMKKDASLKDKKVIIMTNLENEEKVAVDIGADGYFVKSNTKPEEVIEKIKKLVF